MAGNRLRFEEALQRANDAIWAEQWHDAVDAYEQALAEFPDDTSALIGYAWSLLNAGRLAQALKAYRRLTKLIPSDPGPFERIAEILEKQGKQRDAAEWYLQAAERYGKQGLPSKRIAALEAVVRLRPRTPEVWLQLLRLYQEEGQLRQAVHAALWLAYLYQESAPAKAIALCREVQRLTPHDPRLGQTVILLQGHYPVPQPPPLGADTASASGDQAATEAPVIEMPPQTPMEIARQRALTRLAESIFSEEKPTPQGMSQAEVDLLIGKAVDAQTRGEVDTAIQYYRSLLDAGVSLPSIHFNLGLLYKEKMLLERAITEFKASLEDPEYLVASHFALGECYQAQGAFGEALSHFLEAVKAIDIATIQREHVDDLIRVYEGLAQSLVTAGDSEHIERITQTLVDFLNRRGWADAAREARSRLDELARTGTVLSLAELLSQPRADELLRSIGLVQTYQRRQRLYAALEELFHALSIAPDYLPIHHFMGMMLKNHGRLETALEKFRFLARTYEIRGQVSQALTTYKLILDNSPLDIQTHRHVAELLIEHGRIDEALAQYLQTADAYYQLAQPEQALEVYREALRLAPRGSAEKHWEIRILHHIADLDTQRLDWQAAIEDYHEILRLEPDDERAHLSLFRLYTRTGRPGQGIEILDRLIKRYLGQRKVTRVITILEDLVETQPENIPLRARLAQLYLNLGERDKALTHLDILGDLQLEAGHTGAAIKTLEAILALKPPNREAYAELYQQLTQQ